MHLLLSTGELNKKTVKEDIKSELAWPKQEGPVSFQTKQQQQKKDAGPFAAHQPLTYSTTAGLDIDT